jgi:hypothetical protein
LPERNVWSLAEARDALERLIGQSGDWSRLDEFLISYMVQPAMRATVFASSLAATLELVREGVLEVHQQQPFAPIYLRKRDDGRADDRGRGRGPAARRTEIELKWYQGELEACRPWRNDASSPTTSCSRDPSSRNSRRPSRRRGRSTCGCWKRCCLRRRRRSTRRRSPRGCRKASTCARASPRCRPNTPRAASTSCKIGASGRSAPRPTCRGF